MDTKLKADIAESAVVTELLRRGYNVLKPVGDRLPYDLVAELNGTFIKLQVKSTWYDPKKRLHMIDVRRTKTNRRRMLRSRYSSYDFDFAVAYLDDVSVFYVLPVRVFIKFGSIVSFVETEKRQRKPKSAEYRDRWDLLSKWATRLETTEDELPVKFGEA